MKIVDTKCYLRLKPSFFIPERACLKAHHILFFSWMIFNQEGSYFQMHFLQAYLTVTAKFTSQQSKPDFQAEQKGVQILVVVEEFS